MLKLQSANIKSQTVGIKDLHQIMNQQITRILIVEDEHKVALFLKRGLEENNYSCEIAGDGLIGKRLFETHGYDLIILDVNLPFKNGIQLCKEIRHINPKVPVIMLTALGTT